MDKMRNRYLLTMISVGLLDAAMMVIYMIAANTLDAWRQALIQNILLFGLVNAVVSILLYRPIKRFIDADELSRESLSESARKRLEYLPIQSAAWVFALSMTYSVVLFSSGELTPTQSVINQIPLTKKAMALIWFSFVLSVYYSFYTFFAISDFTEQLRASLTSYKHIKIHPKRKRYGRKLLAILIVFVVLPDVHLILDVTFLRDIRIAQGFGLLQTVVIDLIAAAAVFCTVVVFATRSLNRPVENLTFAMQRISEGDLNHKVPVTSDDELGLITDAFNSMTNRLKEQAIVRDTFGKYVPETIAHAIISGQQEIEPKQTLATILYADIEGFTAISEQLTPIQVVDMLNAYFTTILKPIESNDGVVNQFQGDAILVTFNTPITDPDHADHAVTAALMILEAVQKERFADVSLNIRIGINTGMVVAGNVGSAGRFNYTVHGNAVNLAAKLEALNKDYQTNLLISDSTHRFLTDKSRFRKIGEFKIGGESQANVVYGISPPVN